MYKLQLDGSVIRLDDNATIPPDPLNRDWRKYRKWLKQGNKPDPADPSPDPKVTILEQLVVAQMRLQAAQILKGQGMDVDIQPYVNRVDELKQSLEEEK